MNLYTVDPNLIGIAAAAFVALVVIIWAVTRRSKVGHLRELFGPEFDHVVFETGSTRRAERELRQRARRVERLGIRPLSPERRRTFRERWQAQFVDHPREAVDEADHLIEQVMWERGYPAEEFEQRVADISVGHPEVVHKYRLAYDIAERERNGQATTEDLRQAMLYYHELFTDLVEGSPTA